MNEMPRILPSRKDIVEAASPVTGLPSRKHGKKLGRKLRRERRKNAKDRRKEVRDGVVVSLSSTNNRRKKPERRKV